MIEIAVKDGSLKMARTQAVETLKKPFKHTLSYDVEFDGYDLAIARDKKGISQEEMAKRMGDGWYQQKIYKMENKRRVVVTLADWEAMVRVLTAVV